MKHLKKIKILSLVCVVAIVFTSLAGCAPDDTTPIIPDEPIIPNETPYKDANEIDYTFAQRAKYTNNIDVEIATEQKEGIGDPFVMKYNGKYYLYPSRGGHLGIRVFVSDDMINWQYGGLAVDESEGTTIGAYAPEVIYYNGFFYMCQSQGGNGHYIYKSQYPDKGFKIISKNLHRGIDGSFYIDNNGDLYMLYTGGANIDYSLISDANNLDNGGIGGSNYLKGVGLGGWTEGPGVFHRGEYSYVTYTGNHVLSSGYRVAYSYGKNIVGLDDQFKKPDNNIVLIKTGNVPQRTSDVNGNIRYDVSIDGEIRAPGHNSNVVGPDLDSLYSAYHNLVYWVDDGSYQNARRCNIDRYLTNGRDLMINGMTNYAVEAPKKPIYSNDGTSLEVKNGLQLSKESTQGIFTAEMNFNINEIGKQAAAIFAYKDDSNFCEVVVDSNSHSVTLYQTKNGNRAELSTANVTKNNNFSALNTLRVENGFSKSFIYLNNMKIMQIANNLGEGKIGYGANVTPQYTAFSNDVFGTSDFDAVKNLPTKIPAMSYLKGENRGFSISNAAIKNSGFRQGEKENSFIFDERAALLLDTRGDYVKYAVNVAETGWYSFEGEVDRESVGSRLDVIVDNKTKTTLKIADVEFFEDRYENATLGKVYLTKGNHTVKVKLNRGTVEAVNFSFTKNGDANKNFSNMLTDNTNEFLDFNKNYTIDASGATSSANQSSLLLYGNAGNTNYKFSFDYSTTKQGGSSGIVFRMNNYSEVLRKYSGWQIPDAMQGYFLQVTPTSIELSKYNYDVKTRLGSKITTSMFANGATNNIEIEAVQNHIVVRINGVDMIDFYDHNAFLTGQLGFYSYDSVCVASNFIYTNI